MLTSGTVDAMRSLVAETPDKWTSSNEGWGLGWMIYDWYDTPVFGHDGATIGQNAYMRIVPGCDVVVTLMTNGGRTDLLQSILFRELFQELANVKMPNTVFEPSPNPPNVDITPFIGIYKRQGFTMTITERNELLHLQYEISDGRQDTPPPMEIVLIPISATVFAGAGAGQEWLPVIFSTLQDGSVYCYIGMRAAQKMAHLE